MGLHQWWIERAGAAMEVNSVETWDVVRHSPSVMEGKSTRLVGRASGHLE